MRPTRSPHAIAATLSWVDASGATIRAELAPGATLIGRAPANDILIDEPTVSARHARIDVSDDVITVTDVGSTNGTFVDDRRVRARTVISPGSMLRIGRCEVQVALLPGAEPRPTAALPTTATPVTRSRTPASSRTRRPRTLLVSAAPVDLETADRIVERLERDGHVLWIDRSPDDADDGWGGRLLDTVWTCDAAIFVVSNAAASSPRVRHEVHLAAAEHTTVLPVVLDDTALPEDLEYYRDRTTPVDLRAEEDDPLEELARRVAELPTKRVARPWLLARRIALVLVILLLVFAAVRFVGG